MIQKITGAAALALGAWMLTMGFVGEPALAQAREPVMKTARIGEQAPGFSLTDTTGATHTLADALKEYKLVVLEWFNPDCPFVQGRHKTGSTMRDLYAEFKDRGVGWLAINSGAPGKQGAGVERNARAIREYKIAYPVLLDETGMVGRRYGARTTPTMFIINHDGALLYAGAIDGKMTGRPGENFVREALEQALAGETIMTPETRSSGCSVKYAD